MSNRSVGNGFEAELCETLAGYGFWAHNLAQNSAGQPFDVIAVRRKIAYAIDAKVCEHDTFSRSRIEPNQKTAMWMWTACGNGNGLFALKLSDGAVFMIPLPVADLYKTMNRETIEREGTRLEEWVMLCK